MAVIITSLSVKLIFTPLGNETNRVSSSVFPDWWGILFRFKGFLSPDKVYLKSNMVQKINTKSDKKKK